MSSKIPFFAFPERDLFIRLFGKHVYLVGGVVRDLFLPGSFDRGKDIDLVVVGCSYGDIEKLLSPFGKTSTVGKSFAVVKFTSSGRSYDIAVPRRDTRISQRSHSHKNFRIDSGAHISLEEDLSRRDFTCNSMALRLVDNTLIDPFMGLAAIREKKIVMTNPDCFSDDPLRVLRAARFASVLQYSIAPDIYAQAARVQLHELSAERIREELVRLLLESPKPSLGLQDYLRLTILEQLFPELYATSLTIQDSQFHPERDLQGHHTVWAHTLITVDVARQLVRIFDQKEERARALLLAALLHDVGKPATTRWEYKRTRLTITSALHDSQGIRLAEQILDRLKIDTHRRFPLKTTVLRLIQYHHRLFDLYRNRNEIGFKAIARLVKDMDGEDFLLVLLDFADRRSRARQPCRFTRMDRIANWYLKQKEKFEISKDTIRPLVLGRDLLPFGIPPGKKLGQYLKKLYELQLEGCFYTKKEGVKLFLERLAKKEKG